MIETPLYIENHELVLDAFGYWPSFHDAEVHTVFLERMRRNEEGPVYARLEFLIHCWEMTSTVNAQGYYDLTKHHLVRFEFDWVGMLLLEGFNRQNPIFEMTFERFPPKEGWPHRFKVVLDAAGEMDLEFEARAGRVLSVTPCDAEGQPNSVVRIT